jgi:hypothetical protein
VDPSLHYAAHWYHVGEVDRHPRHFVLGIYFDRHDLDHPRWNDAANDADSRLLCSRWQQHLRLLDQQLLRLLLPPLHPQSRHPHLLPLTLELLAARVADRSSDDGTGLVLYSVIVVAVAVLLLVKVIVWAKKSDGAPVSAATKTTAAFDTPICKRRALSLRETCSSAV